MIEVTSEGVVASIQFKKKKELAELELALKQWRPSPDATIRVVVEHLDDYAALRLRKIFLSPQVEAFQRSAVSFRLELRDASEAGLIALFKRAKRAYPTNMTFVCDNAASIDVWGSAIYFALRKGRLGFKTTFDLSCLPVSEALETFQARFSDLVIPINLQIKYPDALTETDVMIVPAARHATPASVQCVVPTNAPSNAASVSRVDFSMWSRSTHAVPQKGSGLCAILEEDEASDSDEDKRKSNECN
ncbi:MAG: hypothetical protein P1U32_08700 [Legionellaceae bacterium]|nr:hypothetical protein [Legionellaceae bacterium]